MVQIENKHPCRKRTGYLILTNEYAVVSNTEDVLWIHCFLQSITHMPIMFVHYLVDKTATVLTDSMVVGQRTATGEYIFSGTVLDLGTGLAWIFNTFEVI